MFEHIAAEAQSRVWDVSALCRAVGDALQARFNPVCVRGEISGFSRAASGHCYFSLKDAQSQVRCAMFRRAASQLDFVPGDGQLVQLHARLGVYEARGDLQLVVEAMQRGGQGALFEQFLRLKAKLQAEGLFDTARKRPLPALPRGIGVVTSPDAAALHDVVSALRRRVPHIPVVLAPALVQGPQAPESIVAALQQLEQLAQQARDPVAIDVILLVRGGGAIEDLWAFNDERVARVIGQCALPVISGVGHESDFTIADFCADLRAPTPTAAAELAAQARSSWMDALQRLAQGLQGAVGHCIDVQHQWLDGINQSLSKPLALTTRQQGQMARLAQSMHYAVVQASRQALHKHQMLTASLPKIMESSLIGHARRLERVALRLQLLDPDVVLQRGYALLSDARGRIITRADQIQPGDAVRARLAVGELSLHRLPLQSPEKITRTSAGRSSGRAG